MYIMVSSQFVFKIICGIFCDFICIFLPLFFDEEYCQYSYLPDGIFKPTAFTTVTSNVPVTRSASITTEQQLHSIIHCLVFMFEVTL